MSKRAFKPQASSSRAASGALSASFGNANHGVYTTIEEFGASPLAYTYEPLDLSGIPDSTLVVSLKNLQKKDGTTKAKALEEIQAYVDSLQESKASVDDALLEAWVKLYPRTSIDNDRRVRQLAHTTQGIIAASAGKRLARYMPAVAGAWLSGLHDNDRPVIRSALESFQKVFATEEKRRGVCKVYQIPIVEYCRNAMLRESEETLSDERTVRPDESKTKYQRVVGSSIAAITRVLENLSDDEVKSKDLYGAVLQSELVWKLSMKGEAFLRRSTYIFLAVALERLNDLLDIRLIRTYILKKGLRTSQIGSANDYARILAQLTCSYPEIWDTSGSKSAPTGSLCHFLQEGSQGGSTEFWRHLSMLLTHLPSTVLSPIPVDRVHGALKALETGIRRQHDYGLNQGDAWKCYLNLLERLQSIASTSGTGNAFVEQSICPFIHDYVWPHSSQGQKPPTGSDQQATVTEAIIMASRASPKELETELRNISATLIENLKVSLPEQAQDYKKSQDTIIGSSLRWYSLQASLLKRLPEGKLRTILSSTASNEQRAAVELIKGRLGRPYSAAATLEFGARITPEITIKQPVLSAELLDFAAKEIPGLMSSPSSPYLLRLLDSLSSNIDTQNIYQDCLMVLIHAPDSTGKLDALRSILSASWPKGDAITKTLAEFVDGELQLTLKKSAGNWQLIDATIANSSTPKYAVDQLLATMTNSLSIENETLLALRGIKTALHQNKQAVRDFITSSDGTLLISRLLFLSQTLDDGTIRDLAARLKSECDGLLSAGNLSKEASNSVIEIIKSGIVDVTDTALPIESLVEQAQLLILEASLAESDDISAELFPCEISWLAVLGPFFNQKIDASLALTNQLGGAIHLVEQGPDLEHASDNLLLFDRDGYSAAFRMASYVSKLARSTTGVTSLSEDHYVVTYRYMTIFSQIARDHLSALPAHGLWEISEGALDQSIIDTIADLQALCMAWTRDSLHKEHSYIDRALHEIYNNSEGYSTRSYYHARAYAYAASELKELCRFTDEEEVNLTLGSLRKSNNILGTLSYLVGYSESKAILKLFNEIVANLTDWKFDKDSEGLPWLVILSTLLDTGGVDLKDIPQHRLVLFVTHIIKVLKSDTGPQSVRAEIFKVLRYVLRTIKGIYGEFWQEIIVGLTASFESTSSSLVTIHAGLRLSTTLQGLTVEDMEETNEDLKECWMESRKPIASALFRLMKMQSASSDKFHQPMRIVNSVLARQVIAFADNMDPDTQEIYPILACESTTLQHSAYELLHQKIPALQEDISLEAVLSKGYVAKLPEELLSLILETPRSQDYQRLQTESEMPSSLARYLLSWKVVFDHWTKASYKVHSDYVDCIKEGTYVKNLLGFTFDFLIRNRDPNHIPKPSRFNIEEYAPGKEETPEVEAQHLLSHLYYLSLLHLPLLAKNWWLTSCPRSLEKRVSAWTEKHISIHVISAELSAVSAWDHAFSDEDPDAPHLEIKTSPRARELTAQLPIDDQTMSIRVSLPAAYPLQPIAFSTLHRVGFDERKWSAWLSTSQIVTNFSSTSQGLGCVIDGLLAWRKNVAGALKGQRECAICYSIVGADGGQLPAKRCATCKNVFHGGCLFRWFKSSSSSGCPLCRNPFNYG